ncbi:MAG: type I-D CRISPR-associated protein Cas7/Csc2 [Anaerolineae bacterium]|nr:type I-D CRISPR-associated protein Cas7/Csc2 [Anaerolineae bacterium]
MTTLNDLKKREDLFFDAIPQLPMGRYVHFVLLRETESFPIFQTDGTLNVIRMQAGLKDESLISRLVMFKRKQSSPERLTGRELLRQQGIITDEKGDRFCEYNSANFCKSCPDCIYYGFAIGDAGAEKSKVYTDSAFSITPYEESHKPFSFNALYEHGTMTQRGETRASFGEQDHVVPQVFFPAIVTLRDPTYEGFLYVLGNILRTDRYGATDTRTGKVKNHLLAVVFTNGEIFSNLRYTQAIYDHLKENGWWSEPLVRGTVLETGESVYAALIAQEPVASLEELTGDELVNLLAEVQALYQDEAQTRALLEALDAKTRKYAEDYGAKKS